MKKFCEYAKISPPMEKIALLLFWQQMEIEYEKLKRLHFRSTGDESVYLIPPAIVLGKTESIDSVIPYMPDLHTEKAIARNDFGFYQKLADDKPIAYLQDLLHIKRMESGIFLSSDAPPEGLYPETAIRIRSLALASYDRFFFKILRIKKLSKDKDH